LPFIFEIFVTARTRRSVSNDRTKGKVKPEENGPRVYIRKVKETAEKSSSSDTNSKEDISRKVEEFKTRRKSIQVLTSSLCVQTTALII